MTSYAWNGWYDGSGDCEPPEPGKWWLTITQDGEEYATVVYRGESAPVGAVANVLEARAEAIVAALNSAEGPNPGASGGVMDERVQAYIDGLRALTAWMERVGDGLSRSDVSGGLSSYATTDEEFAAKVALLEGDGIVDPITEKDGFVRVRRSFGGGLQFYVYAKKEVVLERDNRIELREVEVGEWRFVEPLAGLGPIPNEGGA